MWTIKLYKICINPLAWNIQKIIKTYLPKLLKFYNWFHIVFPEYMCIGILCVSIDSDTNCVLFYFRSFFQSICVLGYCVFPLNVTLIVCCFISDHFSRVYVYCGYCVFPLTVTLIMCCFISDHFSRVYVYWYCVFPLTVTLIVCCCISDHFSRVYVYWDTVCFHWQWH